MSKIRYGIKYIRANGDNLYATNNPRKLDISSNKWQRCNETGTVELCRAGWHAFRKLKYTIWEARRLAETCTYNTPIRCFMVQIKGKFSVGDNKFCGEYIKVLFEIPLGVKYTYQKTSSNSSICVWDTQIEPNTETAKILFKTHCPKHYKKLHGYPSCLKE